MSNDRPKIEAAGREHLGTKYAKRLRSSGRLPAVVYGHQKDPIHVSVDHDELIDHLYGGAHLIDLAHDGGKTETCLIKDIQYDYLGTDIMPFYERFGALIHERAREDLWIMKLPVTP